MKIFLSALENSQQSKKEGGLATAKLLVNQGIKMRWNLMSYYYCCGSKTPIAEYIRDNSEQILIDSGAHSFQFGKKVDWVAYTEQYAEFIKKFDRDNVLGYFEMDIENIIGLDKVFALKKILEQASDKIIPVWHPPRGIENYEKMCEEYSGKIIAIGGFRGTDIKDSQYLSFLKVAKKYKCKVHCLGMTRKEVLDKVPFDFTDSSSWVQQGLFGNIGHAQFKRGHVSKEFSKNKRGVVFVENYKLGMKMQDHYYKKWRSECKD